MTKEYWDAEGTSGLVRKDELPNIAAMTHVDDELDRLLGTLTEVQRRRFDMRVFQGMKMEQIAEKEGTNLYAITKSLDQAKEKLKNLKNFF